MKGKKRSLILSILIVLLSVGVIVSAVLLTNSSKKEFAADGYVLNVLADETGTTVSQLSFSNGTKYGTKYPSSYKFKDISNTTEVVDKNSYIHYNGGSISAFTDGIVVNMAQVEKGYVDFYGIGQGMVLSRVNRGWQIDNNQNVIPFEEILWALDEDTVLAGSDALTLVIGGKDIATINGYMEIRYIDSGIVQVATEDEGWQFVAKDGAIRFGSGSVLDLGSSFFQV